MIEPARQLITPTSAPSVLPLPVLAPFPLQGLLPRPNHHQLDGPPLLLPARCNPTVMCRVCGVCLLSAGTQGGYKGREQPRRDCLAAAVAVSAPAARLLPAHPRSKGGHSWCECASPAAYTTATQHTARSHTTPELCHPNYTNHIMISTPLRLHPAGT